MIGGQAGGIAARAGIGLRAPHLEAVARQPPDIAFFEIHAENFLRASPARDRLEDIRRTRPLSLHGVGLSLGSADGLDSRHLDRVAALAEALEPALISEHLAWSATSGTYLNDLLPVPYTDQALDVVCRNVARLQDRLGRRILLENPSAYLRFSASTRTEPSFLAEIVRRTNCGLLFDVNNVFVTSRNMQLDPQSWLDGLPAEAIGQYHLAGHATNDADGIPILIDDHGSRVRPEVWDLFARTVAQFGPRPTLMEWDTDIPPLAVLLDEAARADAILDPAGTAAPERAA